MLSCASAAEAILLIEHGYVCFLGHSSDTRGWGALKSCSQKQLGELSNLFRDYRFKRFINNTSGDQLPSPKFEDTGKDEHPILLPTTAAPTTPLTTSAITRNTEKPKLLFFTNSPIPQNVASTDSPAQKDPPPPDPRDVIRSETWYAFVSTSPHSEVQKATDRLEGRGDPTPISSKIPPSPDPRDAVINEAQKAIDKHEGREDPTPMAPKDPSPPDPRDVVRNEVQRAIDRIEGRGHPTPMMMDKNVEEIKKPQLSMETELKRYLLYAAPGLGCLLGLLPAVLLVKMCGVRVTLSVTLAVSGILTAIVPVLSQFGFPALFPLRLFMGVCFAPCFPVMGAVCANWGCLNEQLLFIATAFGFIQIAPLLSWPLTMLVFSNEVPLIGIYAFHAVVTLLLSILFATFHRDRPQHHPWVNGLELNKIVAGKVQELKSNRAQAGACPTLLRSLAAWSLWTAAFGLFFGIALVTIYMPSILSCQEIFLVDYLGVSVHFLPFLLAPLGLCVSGVLRSLCLVGRAFTQHIIAYMGASLGVAYVVAPLVVFFYVASNSLAEWTKVFMTAAAIIAVSSIVFAIFGRGRASNWAASTWDPLISMKMRNLQPIDFSQDECGLYELRLIDPNKK
ncbi:transporter, major facilitator family protein [Ancylostoma ceylanicum]|uniref:Transporter, major facilitator family protein n=1 Tax=Ancylostoma ceylanicum TaxID=53326 RepID=A0A0D6LX77_9BILA|nr:transporter, major facilitator family protein [Ancylostoma ceylanicum]